MKILLEDIKKFLERQEIPCVIVPKGHDLPSDQLYVTFGVDEKGRDLLLQIKITEEDLSDSYKLFHLDKKPSKLHLVQFFLGLPFQVKADCVGEVARLILLLNKSFGLPGFEFSEVDRVIYFRSTLMVSGNDIEEMMIIATIGNLMTYVDTFSEILESVAEGKKSLAEVVGEYHKTS